MLHKPLNQWLTFVALMVLLIIVFRPQKEDTLWVIAGVTYLVFILTNTIFIWMEERIWVYFFFSLLLSVLYLAAASLLVTTWSKLVTTEGSGESSMIFLVIIYHPVLLLLALGVKWLYFKIF